MHGTQQQQQQHSRTTGKTLLSRSQRATIREEEYHIESFYVGGNGGAQRGDMKPLPPSKDLKKKTLNFYSNLKKVNEEIGHNVDGKPLHPLRN